MPFNFTMVRVEGDDPQNSDSPIPEITRRLIDQMLEITHREWPVFAQPGEGEQVDFMNTEIAALPTEETVRELEALDRQFKTHQTGLSDLIDGVLSNHIRDLEGAGTDFGQLAGRSLFPGLVGKDLAFRAARLAVIDIYWLVAAQVELNRTGELTENNLFPSRNTQLVANLEPVDNEIVSELRSKMIGLPLLDRLRARPAQDPDRTNQIALTQWIITENNKYQLLNDKLLALNPFGNVVGQLALMSSMVMLTGIRMQRSKSLRGG